MAIKGVVEVANFGNPVKPSSVIINDTTVINKTTLIASPKRGTRSLGGGAPQKIVINEGPSVDVIRKATGKSMNVVSVREATSQTSVPSEAMRTMNASRKDERPGGQSNPNPGWKSSPQYPPGVTPPGKEFEPTGRGFGYYAPHGPPRPDGGERSPNSGKGKEAKDVDKGGH